MFEMLTQERLRLRDPRCFLQFGQRQVPGQAKKKPDWASKKTADAALKQLKAAATGTATASPGGDSLRAQDFGEGSPGRLGHP